MNQFISDQIDNMTATAAFFKKSCKMAALEDDGIIDKEEEKLLAKINKVTDRFISDLNKLS